ncbi:hypothetical protein Ciccas_014389, partial [Cichlidogyrus casuarinus]
ISFIDFIIMPLWDIWSELLHPDCQLMLDSVRDNRVYYAEQFSNCQEEAEQSKEGIFEAPIPSPDN